MENVEKTVSIIVPVYKIVPEYLKICIGSLINQTCRDIEIILIDDGSPDECGAICDQYAVHDSRIKVIHQKNKGVSAARNKGIDAASGDYVMFVDADDWLEKDCVKSVLEEIRHQNVDLVLFQHVIEHSGKSIPPQKIKPCSLSSEELKEIQLRILMNQRFYKGFDQRTSWGKIIKKSCLTQDVRFPEKLIMSEDMVFNLLLLENISSAFALNYIGYHYRMNGTSVTHRYNPMAFSVAIDVVSKMDWFVKNYHEKEPEYGLSLGEGTMKMIAIIEKNNTFHKDCPLSRSEVIAVTEKYLNHDLVKKYSSECSVRSCKSMKGRFRYLLQSGKNLNLYYFVVRILSKYIWRL